MVLADIRQCKARRQPNHGFGTGAQRPGCLGSRYHLSCGGIITPPPCACIRASHQPRQIRRRTRLREQESAQSNSGARAAVRLASSLSLLALLSKRRRQPPQLSSVRRGESRLSYPPPLPNQGRQAHAVNSCVSSPRWRPFDSSPLGGRVPPEPAPERPCDLCSCNASETDTTNDCSDSSSTQHRASSTAYSRASTDTL